jgi:hypothetical protein
MDAKPTASYDDQYLSITMLTKRELELTIHALFIFSRQQYIEVIETGMKPSYISNTSDKCGSHDDL